MFITAMLSVAVGAAVLASSSSPSIPKLVPAVGLQRDPFRASKSTFDYRPRSSSPANEVLPYAPAGSRVHLDARRHTPTLGSLNRGGIAGITEDQFDETQQHLSSTSNNNSSI